MNSHYAHHQAVSFMPPSCSSPSPPSCLLYSDTHTKTSLHIIPVAHPHVLSCSSNNSTIYALEEENQDDEMDEPDEPSPPPLSMPEMSELAYCGISQSRMPSSFSYHGIVSTLSVNYV
ncbi:hypothetical protein Pmani_028706 [Petrolisthes manimaculis]|uniref:Uncharacterized protein n=1 Tax=Petrolisthes manimaculis TaxID=1843537 RepID=A0AAE1TXS3_9EUCA|nr:hypothetical protein Pmani_028706 [Petrolisthes manimaculis]